MADMSQDPRSMTSDLRVASGGPSQGSRSMNGPYGDNLLGMANYAPYQQQQPQQQQNETYNGIQQKYPPPTSYQATFPPPNTIQKQIPTYSSSQIGYPRPPQASQIEGNQSFARPQFYPQSGQAPAFDRNRNENVFSNGPNVDPLMNSAAPPMPNGPGIHPGIRPPPNQIGMQNYRPQMSQAGIQPSNGGVSTLGNPYSNQPNLLVPYDSWTPTSISPARSEPTSSKSSRNPSPIPTQRYDAMEGQFSSGPSPSASYSNIQAMNPQIRGPIVQKSMQNVTSSPSSIAPPTSASLPMAQSIGMPSMGQPTSMPSMAQPLHPSLPSGVPQGPGPHQGSQFEVPPYQVTSQAVPQQQQIPPSKPVGNVAGRRQYPQQAAYDQAAAYPPPSGNFQPPAPSGAIDTATSTSYPNYGDVYGGQQQTQGFNQATQDYNQMSHQFDNLHIQNNDPVDLLQNRNILPPLPIEPTKIVLPQQQFRNVQCNPDIFRCTLTKIPDSASLLQKSRLPLGILIHPFKDLSHLAVIQCASIVRCRYCRTYINPFVQFIEHRRWKCNLCYRLNDLPDEFLYDPLSKNYGDPARRPEVKSATIEFIAPSEYMLRPPQPAVYLFVLDVSRVATDTGYLRIFCDTLLDKLDKIPGDTRTQIGFITYDSCVHFYNLSEGLSQPQMIVVSDVDEIFLPYPDNLLVNLYESKELIQDLIQQLPIKFMESQNPDSAMGAALQAAYKLISPTGGRITVFQSAMPNIGPGAVKPREDPNMRAAKDVQNLGPANDFYKKLSLDCSGQQVAVDLFVMSSQYIDIATLSCASKYSGGCIHYYQGFNAYVNAAETDRFEGDLRRYLTRKVGFESVMRIRCTKGLNIHTFHGNFFVRSTDLLSLPNINPDAGFGMQVSIVEQLSESNTACFQAALLYTSSKGERRIRVHTLCLPVTNSLTELLGAADQQAIVGLLVKMAADRSITSSLTDAREALINACVDPAGVFKMTQTSGYGRLLLPSSLRLLPMYILAVLKHAAFRVGVSTRLDERVYAMNQMKTLPLAQLMLYIYPSLYPVHALDSKNALRDDDKIIPQPPLLHLSSEKIDSHGAYLLDTGHRIILYVCRSISDQFCNLVFQANNFSVIDDRMIQLPELENPLSELLRTFVSYLQSQRPFPATFNVIREDSKNRQMFLQYLIEDRSESSYSYYEFLQYLKQLLTK